MHPVPPSKFLLTGLGNVNRSLDCVKVRGAGIWRKVSIVDVPLLFPRSVRYSRLVVPPFLRASVISKADHSPRQLVCLVSFSRMAPALLLPQPADPTFVTAPPVNYVLQANLRVVGMSSGRQRVQFLFWKQRVQNQ